MTTANLLRSQWYEAVFGGRALELAGRVVRPDYQGQGVATQMLQELVQSERPQFLTTYTRSPKILRMVNRVSSELYPTEDDAMLQSLASEMPFAEAHEGIFYHINRYDDYEEGLFVGEDPANEPFKKNGLPLKQQLSCLRDARNALVVAARVRR